VAARAASGTHGGNSNSFPPRADCCEEPWLPCAAAGPGASTAANTANAANAGQRCRNRRVIAEAVMVTAFQRTHIHNDHRPTK